MPKEKIDENIKNFEKAYYEASNISGEGQDADEGGNSEQENNEDQEDQQ